ncbi:LPS assembly lipoprotein LptE [Ferrovum sp.]|uniref:LPS-assembly lipoprotein LptE n=1 Tax=Ferrovum sp. TaxID=2609467 RepID=UPI00262A51E5|nr:LPS assembly lipoprotein LptE [Ferrovum sp.]
MRSLAPLTPHFSGLWKTIFFVLFPLTLGACGFHLRGLPEAQFHTLYLDGKMGDVADQELKLEILHQTHITLVKQSDKADVVLTLSPIQNTQQILTLNAEGTVSQYTLYARLSYRASDNLGNELIPPSTLTVTRLYNYNVIQILGKPAEQQLLTHDMQIDLVHQLLHRVLALHPALGTAAH